MKYDEQTYSMVIFSHPSTPIIWTGGDAMVNPFQPYSLWKQGFVGKRLLHGGLDLTQMENTSGTGYWGSCLTRMICRTLAI